VSTPDFLDQLSVAVRRDAARQQHRRRLAVVAVALVTLVVGGVGIAGTYDDWWTNNVPAVQPGQLNELAGENDSSGIHLDLSKKATVARTGDADLDAVATNGGKGYCMSLFLNGTTQMGASCTTQSDSEYLTRADDSHWIGYGRILDDGAAALDLSGAGLSSHVALERGGFFLFDIPRADWTSLDGRTGDIAILDASGKTIRGACIFVGIAPPSPYEGAGALGDKPGTCDALKPIVPDPELDKATKLVSLTLRQPHISFAAGETISFWKMPNRGGGYCWQIGLAPSEHGSGGCAQLEQRVFHGHMSTGYSDGIVNGWAPTDSGIVRITVNGADAALANGAFLAEAGAPGPKVIVGYDAAGKEVAVTRLPAR
jgi:hypothetical protein